MHTATAQHNPAVPPVDPARVTLVMSAALKNRLLALATTEHRTLSAQCVFLIERALDTAAA